jgi:hypothetical protein
VGGTADKDDVGCCDRFSLLFSEDTNTSDDSDSDDGDNEEDFLVVDVDVDVDDDTFELVL